MESGIDLYPGNEHRYAIFLNYMPNSFLESDLRGYTISESGLRLQFDLFGIENLMHSNEIERIMQHIPLEYFAQIFNSHSNAWKKFWIYACISNLCYLALIYYQFMSMLGGL